MKLLLLSTMFVSLACSPKPPTVHGTQWVEVNDDDTREKLRFCANLGVSPETDILEVTEEKEQSKEETQRPKKETKHVTVYFDTGLAQFQIPQRVREEITPLLVDAKEIVVKGRTDGTGEEKDNLSLAKERALSAWEFLVGHGAKPSVITMNFAASEDYIAPNDTEVGRSQNRRVEIAIDTLLAPKVKAMAPLPLSREKR